MKHNALHTTCALLILLSSCSETDFLGDIPSGESVAVRFSMTMEPIVGVTRTIITDTTLPTTAESGKQIGIYGIRTEAECIDTLKWQTNSETIFQHPLNNCPYNIKANNQLETDSATAYYPMGGNPALAVYAYWPHKQDTLIDGYGTIIPVDLKLQEDILYTGKVSSVSHAGSDNETINLPFKHALGAVAFKFTAEEPLYIENRWLKRMELITSYSLDDAWMSVADGQFVFPFGQKADTLALELGNQAIELPQLQTNVLGPFLLIPEIELKAIRLFLNYQGVTHIYTIDIEGNSLFTLEAGVMKVLSFRCTEAPVYVQTRGNMTHELTFTLEEIQP